MSNLVGQSLGRYHIVEQLGEGGMATVFKAYDTRLERDVAIKIIRRGAFPPDQLEMILKRFEREAKSLGRLSHPNIVKVHDYGEFDGAPYLVLEYLPGGTLKDRLHQQNGKPMPWQQATQVLLPIARALQFAHEQGIVHRDVKPSNILITLSGEPMLSDFGIAKILDSTEASALTGTSTAIGTPEYMAPEQWIGGVSPKSDMYSLGVIFYEMVAGRKPYVADTPAAILLKQANEGLPRPSQFAVNLPDSVENILFKLLAREPENRYADMAAFIKAVVDLLPQENGAATVIRQVEIAAPTMVVPQPQKEHRSARTRRWIPAVIGVFLLLILAGGGTWLFTSGPLGNHPSATLPVIAQDQIYILNVSKTTLSAQDSSGKLTSIGSGNMIDFVPGTVIRIDNTADGYARLVFPGPAEAFFAPGAEATLLASDATGILLRLERGKMLVHLPEDFSSGRRFTVQNASGASAWVSGSLMGLEQDLFNDWLYVDCLEHECWVSNGDADNLLSAGQHAVLDDSFRPPEDGINFDLWVFAPDVVLAPSGDSSEYTQTPTTAAISSETVTAIASSTSTSTKKPTSVPVRYTNTPVPPTPVPPTPVPPTKTPVPPPSKTPEPAYDEAIVRYYMAEWSFVGPNCGITRDRNIIEACKRWDAGIYVVNLSDFIYNKDLGKVCWANSPEKVISGWDVKLSR